MNKSRNFRILEEKLDGLSVPELSEKYDLSKSSIYNIINSQKAKIADYDNEYKRRLMSLTESLEESEENSKYLAEEIRSLKVHNKYLDTELNLKENENRVLRDQVLALSRSGKELSDKVKTLERAIKSGKSAAYVKEYENIKESFNKYRS